MTDLNIPFTQMGAMVDAAAVNGCVASGLIVIVEVEGHRVSGIVSAHTKVEQAYLAYREVEMNDSYAIIVPSETGPRIFYDWLTREELQDVHRAKIIA